MEIFYAREFDLMQEYANERSFRLTKRLGSGQDGLVYATSNDSAITLLFHQPRFEREYSVYMRLQERDIIKVERFAVPRLVNADCHSAFRCGFRKCKSGRAATLV